MSNERIWWYSEADQKIGPQSILELSELIFAKKISGDSLVWKSGLSNWLPISSVRELDTISDPSNAVSQPPPLPISGQPPELPNSVEPSASPSSVPLSAAEVPSNQQIALVATEQVGAENKKNDVRPRLYEAPRLDAAFDAQAKIFKHGTRTFPIITLLSFLGGGLGALCLIGLVAYWVVYFKNKGELESLEIELCGKNKEDGLRHDISDMKCAWFKFGAPAAYFLSIAAVVFLVCRWFLIYIINNSRRY